MFILISCRMHSSYRNGICTVWSKYQTLKISVISHLYITFFVFMIYKRANRTYWSPLVSFLILSAYFYQNWPNFRDSFQSRSQILYMFSLFFSQISLTLLSKFHSDFLKMFVHFSSIFFRFFKFFLKFSSNFQQFPSIVLTRIRKIWKTEYAKS